MRRNVMAVAVLACMALLAGCPQGHRIGDLTRDPGRYYNKEVAVSGNVTSSFGLMGSGAYEVDDGTGTIWVLSSNYGVPSKGAHVTVAGTLIQGADFGGRSFGLAIRETRRRH